MAGAILHFSGGIGLLPYPTLFVSTAVILAAVGIFYGLGQRRGKSFGETVGLPGAQHLAESSPQPAIAGGVSDGDT